MVKKKALLLALASAALLAFSPASRSEAPQVKTQVPGYYRTQLGQFEVTALFDGALELDTQLLKNTPQADLGKLLERMFVGNPKMQTAVNAYLINTGKHLVLVDAGAAQVFGPGLGQVLQNLKAAGYDPAQVDTVVVTHLHGDHMGGLNDANGQPVFAKARVLVPQGEQEFWLSEKASAAAPEKMRPYFKLAQNTAAPYQARGKWQTFASGTELVPGIRAVEASGHTPGHTAYAITSQDQTLFIWGDIVHAHAVQFAHPGIAIEFDVDPQQAIATRRALMREMAKSRTLVAGMHLPFPGMGHIRAEGEDSFAWVPVEFSPLGSTPNP